MPSLTKREWEIVGTTEGSLPQPSKENPGLDQPEPPRGSVVKSSWDQENLRASFEHEHGFR